MTWRYFFFFNDTATTEIYTLSLHDALPIFRSARANVSGGRTRRRMARPRVRKSRQAGRTFAQARGRLRSEEHTSELQSRQYLVCRLLLEKKKTLRVLRALNNTQSDTTTQLP